MPPFHAPLYSNQGCVYSFRPSVAPIPPVPPQPPATRPPPPACGVFPTQQGGPTAGASLCTLGGSLNFSNVFSDFAVLQMAPARSAVYGYLGTNATKGGATTVTITVAGAANTANNSGSSSAFDATASYTVSYTVQATVNADRGTWKAFLKPTAAGGSYSIKAACTGGGCTGGAEIKSVTFGDVWYCAGQSNMALPVQFTYARNASIDKIKAGKGGDIRFTGLNGNMNKDQPWITLEDAVGGTENKTMPGYEMKNEENGEWRTEHGEWRIENDQTLPGTHTRATRETRRKKKEKVKEKTSSSLSVS